MKGFVKVLEMIIATIIILSSFTYFFPSYIKPSEWPKAELQIQAQDVLKSLDESGELREFILENNLSGFENRMREFLPKTANFLIEVDNLPKPNIRIACNCTDEEKTKLQRMLHINSSLDQKITFKGREIEFLILEERGLDEILEHDAQWDDVDVIVLFHPINLSEYMSSIEDYLSRGNGLVLISNLTSSDIDENYKKLFNLSWDLCSLKDENEFYSGALYDKVTDYFVNMPIRIKTNNNTVGEFVVGRKTHLINTYYNTTTDTDYVIYNGNYYVKGDIFQADDEAGINWTIKIMGVNAHIGNETYVDISIQNKTFIFRIDDEASLNCIQANEKTIIYESGTTSSSLQANYMITKYGEGRTMWIKDYNEKYSDVNQLFKSMILWVAGEKYIMAHSVFDAWYKKRIKNIKSFVKVHYLVSGLEEFQPFYVDLIVWYIYQ